MFRKARIPPYKFCLILLIVYSSLLPFCYFILDPTILDITDRENYEEVFAGNTNADTAFYPLFLVITSFVSSLLKFNYDHVSLFYASAFSLSSVLLFGWQLGRSYKFAALSVPILSSLVLFSYYTIKISFALKKIALGLFFVNLSLLADNFILIIFLRVCAILIHPQVAPLLFLPRRVNFLVGVKKQVALYSIRSFLSIDKKAIARSVQAISLLAILIFVILYSLRDYGDVFHLAIESLSYKFSYYVGESVDIQLIFLYSVICLVASFVVGYLLRFRDTPMAIKFYYSSSLIYIFSFTLVGTSRLFFYVPYFL
jgi:hypothetical protein